MPRRAAHALTAMAALCATAAFARAADAACPPPRPAPEMAPTATLEARAKALFEAGSALLAGGDHAGALDLFLQSRAILPRYANTQNAAVCLLELGRFDEALFMYEDLLAQFGGTITEAQRAAITRAIERLQGKVGTLRLGGGEGVLELDDERCGALPIERPVYVMPGKHVLRVDNPGGRVPPVKMLTLDAGQSMRFKLDPPPPPPPPAPPPKKAPRPPRLRPGWFLEVSGGLAAGPVLGSDAEREAEKNCDDCPGAVGYVVAGRGGYVLASGAFFGFAAGYTSVSSTFTRRIEDRAFPVTYRLAHDIQFRAPFMGPVVGYRLSLGSVGLLARGALGGAYVQSEDPTGGTATNDQGSASVLVEGRRTVLFSPNFFVMPELGVDVRWGRLHVGLSVGVLAFMMEGPAFRSRSYGVSPLGCDSPMSRVPACAPMPQPLPPQVAYRPTQLFLTQLVLSIMP